MLMSALGNSIQKGSGSGVSHAPLTKQVTHLVCSVGFAGKLCMVGCAPCCVMACVVRFDDACMQHLAASLWLPKGLRGQDQVEQGKLPQAGDCTHVCTSVRGLPGS